MSIRVAIRGRTSLLKQFNRMDKAARDGLLDGMDKSGRLVRDQARQLILSPPKTGRMVRRSRPPRIVQASAPGQAPAEDLGKLRRSIHYYVDRKRMLVNVGSYNRVAMWLQLGTKHILPRPFLDRAFQMKRRQVAELIGQSIRGEFRKYWR